VTYVRNKNLYVQVGDSLILKGINLMIRKGEVVISYGTKMVEAKQHSFILLWECQNIK